MKAEIEPDDPEIERKVVELGRRGLSRAEIAIKLGYNFITLEARETADPSFAEAVWLAAVAEAGWWNRQLRAMLASKPTLRNLPWRLPPPRPAPPPEPYRPRWRHGGFY
jgi:hypothetical protein